MVGPAWAWLDPYTTAFDVGAWILRRLGITAWAPANFVLTLLGMAQFGPIERALPGG